MKKLVIISLLFLTACGTQEIEFPDSRDVVVVEGWVTSEEKEHWVKLSRTVGFQNAQSEVPIEDAIVSISDNINTYNLTHSENGIYLSDTFAGVIGRFYRLTITLSDGEEIASTFQRLNAVPDVQEITFESFIEQDDETGEDIEIFYPIVTLQDPAEEQNFYRYKGYRNSILLNLAEELELLHDQFNNGLLLDNHIPTFRYTVTDEAMVEVHSLSESAYDFLDLLKNQTTSFGSSAGTSPATLIGNLSYDEKNEIVLGFFGASDVKSISATVE